MLSEISQTEKDKDCVTSVHSKNVTFIETEQIAGYQRRGDGLWEKSVWLVKGYKLPVVRSTVLGM